MKQQTIETGLCTLLLVELPEGSINPVISMGYIIFKEPNYSNWLNHEDTMNPLKMIEWEDTHDPKDDYKDGVPVRIPDGNWKLIGRLPELTEDEASQLFGRNSIFKLYQYDIDRVPYMFTTGLEALENLLRANDIMFENPLDRIHPHLPNYTGIAESVDEYLDKSEEWQEAQSKVFDKERTYLFIKID